MSARLGLEIGAHHVRAVKVEGVLRRRVRAMEVSWNGEPLEEAIARVQAELGGARHVAVALDLSLVLVKEVALPALPAAGKMAVLALEPERYFPIRGEELVVTARDRDGLAFAARERFLVSALDAVGRLGGVDRVEAAPHALVRALSSLGVRTATVVLRPPPKGSCVVRLEGGALAGVRWLYDEAAVGGAIGEVPPRALYAMPQSSVVDAMPLPVVRGIGEQFLVAFGAALGVGAPLGETLVTPELARRITARRRWKLAAAIAVVAAAGLFALSAFDRAAAATAGALAARAGTLATAAEGAVALRAQSEALDRQLRAAQALGDSRPRPLAGLAALGRRLPSDAHVRTLRAAGNEWQIDGYAREAARLVPLLEGAPEFEQVRFLSATTSERVDRQVHETFSIAFRLARQP